MQSKHGDKYQRIGSLNQCQNQGLIKTLLAEKIASFLLCNIVDNVINHCYSDNMATKTEGKK
jgi:hypothetical protein